MIRLLFLLILPLMAVAAEPFSPPDNQKIVFQNSIVAKVNGKTISMMDVKKKLDLFFHKNYPQLAQSSTAKYQFYQQSWRHVVGEMIDHELILADAEEKEIKLTDGEVREEMENRFGPNTLTTLDKIGITYEEALKMVKDEMIVQRMSWWFIQAKAMQKVTPEEIRQSYRFYVKNNPAYDEWKYKVITIKGEEGIADQALALLAGNNETLDTIGKAMENVGASIQISNELIGNDKDISDAYKQKLALLSPGQFSTPLIKGNSAKIFYCIDVTHHSAPNFEEMQAKLREELLQKALQGQSTAYLEKLRKHYGYDSNALKATIPADLEPFSIESF